MCGQHSVRAYAEDNTGQNTDTPNPRAEIKVPDPAGNRTRAAGLEGRDNQEFYVNIFQLIFLKYN